MSEPEIVYSSSFMPDPTSALDVLRFLIVPERLFYQAGDDVAQIQAVREVLHDAKRDALLRWYEAHMQRQG